MVLRSIAFTIFLSAGLGVTACRSDVATNQNSSKPASFQSPANVQPTPNAPPSRPNLQSEILDDRFKTSNSPLTKIDFKNYSYPLPHGWQNPDNSDLTLTNGKLDPVSADT